MLTSRDGTCNHDENKVETKDLCTVRYSSTSNKDLLFCGFEVCQASTPSYLDRPQRIDHGVENELARLLCSLTFDELQMINPSKSAL
jgi:hypothetical protein